MFEFAHVSRPASCVDWALSHVCVVVIVIVQVPSPHPKTPAPPPTPPGLLTPPDPGTPSLTLT